MSNAIPISHRPSSMAEELSGGIDDDNASLSSLFYSCMSTASAIANAADCDHEQHDHVPGLPSSSSNEQCTHHTVDTLLSQSNHANIKDNTATASRPPSDSSWSIPSVGERPSVRSITFNRDRTCLIICTSFGVRVRTLESLQLSLNNLVTNNELDNKNTNSDQIRSSSSTWVHDVSLPPDGAMYAQLLHSTSLLAVVKPSSPRCCYLFNIENTSSPLATLSLSAAVKRVELQRNVVVAMTVDLRLHVFHLTVDSGSSAEGESIDRKHGVMDLRFLQPTLITTLNIMHPSDSPRSVTRGIDCFNAGSYFDLSPSEQEPYLICKSFNGSPGTVRVYDPTKVHVLPKERPSGNVSVGSEGAMSADCSWDKRYDSITSSMKVKRRIHFITSINAHDHSVNRMLIGGGDGKVQSSTYLATTSAHGTRVRVFGLPNGENLWEWHRGSKSCHIYSLSWNGTANRLAAFGSSGTIHLFEWQKEKRPRAANHDDEDEGSRDFEQVHVTKSGHPRPILDENSLASEDSKPFFRRIASSIKRRTSGRSDSSVQVKNRSFAKLKYKPSLASSSSNASTAKTQTLVLAMLDTYSDENNNMMKDSTEIEDTLVVCSLDGELRRYSLRTSVELTQVEDVLSRG